VTWDQRAVAIAVQMALLATGLGLLRRGRWRLCVFFAAYVIAVLTGNLLVTWWPRQFYVPGFWMAKQVLYDALKLGLAIELAWRTFRVFPGGRQAARATVLAILVVTTTVTLGAPIDISTPGSAFLTAISDLHPRVLNGTLWIMAATLGVAVWYRIPLHPFHAALLTSFGAYLALFGTLLRLLGQYGWAALPYVNGLDPLAYLLLTCWWTYVAWRPESEAMSLHVETVRKLSLRTSSCG
jgi:hypothetical protein